MVRLSLQFFGAFQVHIDNRPITKFRSNKVRALLAYLAVTGQSQERGTLTGLLWAEMPERTARRNLTQTLRFLRQALGDGDWITADNRLIALNQKPTISLDTSQFQTHLDQNNHQAALDLYQGQFLAGFALPDSIPFEDWLLASRDRLQQQVLTAMTSLTEEQLQAGNYAAASQTARRQLAIDPWREPAYRQLMRGLVGLGDRSGALLAFAECRQNLTTGLGVAPSAATTALHKQIQAGESRAAPPKLPRPTTPFIGRQTEIGQLASLLTDGNNPLVNIVAPGGMGKTRLALQVAATLTTKQPTETADSPFPDGIIFIPLASHTDPATLSTLIAQGIGYRLHDNNATNEQVLDYLQQKSLLLILDNFEQFIPQAIPFLLQIIAQANCQLCLTSRQRLQIQAETAFLLDGMFVTSEAIQLFLQTARRIYTQFAPSPAEMAYIAIICQRLHGVPLAILLAAAWIDTLSVAQIAAEIQQDLDFLAAELHDLPPRQRSMRAVFAYSWDLLNEQEQVILAKLAIFRGGFTRESGRAVTGVNLHTLARLVSKSLVQYDSTQERYEIHELLHQFCAEKLAKTGQFETISQIHSQYFLQWAQAQEATLRGHSQISALRLLVNEQENLKAAWHWAVAHHEWPRLHQALEAIFLTYDLSGRHLAGTRLFEQTRAQLTTAVASHSHDLLYLRARLLNRLHLLTRYSSQQKVGGLHDILDLFRQRGEQLEEGLALGWLADRAFQERDIPQAVSLYQQQLSLYQAVDDPMRIALSLCNLANTLLWAGQVPAAVDAIRRCLALTQRHGDQPTTSFAYILYCASNLYFTGDYEAAAQHIDQAFNLNTQLHQTGFHTPWMLISLVYQGYLRLIAGDLEGLAQKCQQAHEYVAQEGATYPVLLADSLDSLFKATMGEYEAAYLQAMTALSRSRQAGADLLGLQAIAISACGLGELAQARQNVLYIWQLSVAANLPNIPLLLSLLPVVAYLLTEAGQPERAVAVLTMGQAHPACPHGWWKTLVLIQMLEARWQAELSAKDYAAAQAQGQELEMEETAVSLLHTLTDS